MARGSREGRRISSWIFGTAELRIECAQAKIGQRIAVSAERTFMDQLAPKLAQYALGAIDTDFPRLARSWAADAIIDCVACMLAGSREPRRRPFRLASIGAIHVVYSCIH